jgi:TolB-like protein/Tfp pilus assembly protein PilF
MENSKPSIQIDLNEFKLHLHLKNKPQRTFHFDSPSRRFYLSVIALVVNEMKKSGKIKSIPLLQHLDLLALLNESIGDAAGSSERENLLHRIYRKWKDALPNLEEAPLFKVLGKKKEEGDGAIGKVYSFTDAEKDDWANLFEYIGSHENVRLKFAVDKIGIGLGETSIVFGDFVNGDAWDRFISSLKKDEKAYLSPGIKAVSVNRMQYLPPDRPSIAVLPFVNMSEDPGQEFFSDGITEDIIIDLSKVSALTVISWNSTFLYKGKKVKIEDVARDLGVSHVLEGSVRRAGGRVRITAQLIDGRTGQHVWADKYDRELKDIFSVQDEVTRKVVSELAVAITATETERVARKHTNNFETYDMYLRARREYFELKKENQFKAIELTKRVIDFDPNFAGGYQLLSDLMTRGVRFGWSESPREDQEKAFELAQKAISLDDKFPFSYFALANCYLTHGKHDDALATAEKAVSIVPGDSWTTLLLGFMLNYAGRGEEAIAAVKKARELNPLYLSGRVSLYLDVMATACFNTGQYEEAISNMKKSIERYGSSTLRNPYLIASYSMLGRMDEAREAARQWLKAEPTFSLSSWPFPRLYKRVEDGERLLGALRKAGLK